MALPAGARFGPYEIRALLGAGGMGDVYRARDSGLNRDVALKVLPDLFAFDPERLARFKREAQVLASLNHPNIAAIFGVEETEGVRALVLELVEGETLADRIARGPVPLDDALPIARQITEALEAAHEGGVIHRDLKPDNIKVRPDGIVKVLDFGLAKLAETAGAGEVSRAGALLSQSPTITSPAAVTGVGMLLGTAAYMSPEQAKGREADKRSDVWAFGCVLFEMLTGRRAFGGEDVTDTIAAVVRADPDWRALPADTPSPVRRLLRRCLEKDRRERIPDIAVARIELRDALREPATEIGASQSAGSTRAQRAPRWGFAAAMAVAGLALVAATGAAVWNLKPESSSAASPVSRFTISLPPGEQLAQLGWLAVAVSPDGSRFAYVASRGTDVPGARQIYVRELSSLEARPVMGTEGANNPFFSADGEWLGFYQAGSFKKVSVKGGASVDVAAGPNLYGTSWSPGTIVFSLNSVLQQVSDAGGTPHQLTHLEQGESWHRWPEMLPDEQAVLFASDLEAGQVGAHNIRTGERRNLTAGTSPRYVASGHLVFAQAGTLMAAPFDPERLNLTGGAVPVLENVLQGGGPAASGGAQYSVSANGTLIYVPGGLQSRLRRLVWVSRSGVEQPLSAPVRGFVLPRLSPDGLRVAVDQEGIDPNVWLYDLARDTLSRLTIGGPNSRPLWAPDGKRVAFFSTREGRQNVFWQVADGGGELEQLTSGEYAHVPSSFSPDGQLLAFYEINPVTRRDIWVLRLNERKAEPFLATPADEVSPKFSPDGRWLAYESDESGQPEIYVRAYPGPGGRFQISSEGGREAAWNPNGRELFYRNGNRMMAVEITTQPTLVAGKPRMLFEGYVFGVVNGSYDVSADGERFLMLKEGEETAPATQINVVLNWFDELKRLVPVPTR